MTEPRDPLRVLLVEDSAEDAEMMERALHDAGLLVEVRVVEDEARLRAELAGFVPELVIADWRLPSFSGAGAVAIARAWNPDIPCILVSGSIGEDLVVEALHIRATDYVLKGHLEALAPAVRRAVAEQAARTETTRLEVELGATQAALRGALESMTDPFAICTASRDASGAIDDFIVLFANAAAAAFVGVEPNDVIGCSFRSALPIAIRDDFYPACIDVVENRHGYRLEGVEASEANRTDSAATWLDITVEPFGDGFFVVFRDVTARTLTARERDQLAAIVEESVDGISLADSAGRLTYANAAFEAMVALPLAEIIGRPLPAVARAVLDAETIAEVYAHVRSAGDWRGEVALLTGAGQPRQVEVAVRPRVAVDGTTSSIVTVVHDVTELREAQADLQLQATIRANVSEILRAVSEDMSLEQAAQMICDQLVTLPGFDQASLDLFLAPDDLRVLGCSGPSGFPLAVGDRLPAGRAALIHERLGAGPWAWYSTDDPTGDEWAVRTVAAGLRASAYGPMVFGDELVGVVVIGTYGEAFARTLVEKVPAIVSFSSASSGLLATRMHAMRREASLRRSLESVIATRAFHPVFQPIVDLESESLLGYEALTRFDSGQRPDLCFADAHSVGLGAGLELATLEAALASATSLPSGLWLSLNLSPILLAEPGALRAVLQSAERPLMLEVSEHDHIGDYAAVRDAVRSTGKSTRLAVDDAGVGVANFNHIIELRPDFVKLDISLVRGVSVDLGRQAMVVGLQHFARTAGCRLIAEGIETEQEATTLRRLGVEFGQGYLFGRPEPVDALTPAPSPLGRSARTSKRVARTTDRAVSSSEARAERSRPERAPVSASRDLPVRDRR